ncbi:MAG: sigma-70 family RNA polymerase sigma factor [Melioribacteraceae bacterium]|nr:sigma-70 family RNA polymerase sigma factor [Melioribacteraceae bacterium]
MNENELIEKAQNGDRKSLAELVKMYEQTVYNFAFKICRDKERAENTMQETFLRMVKNLKQFSGKSKLSTWLYTVVSNNCLMLARSNKRREYTSIDDDDNLIKETKLVEWKYTPANVTENNELKEVLDDAIKNLPPDYRVVFLLRDVEGLSTEETGKITDLSIAAVKSRLHRARAFLRNEISGKLSYESN